MTSKLPTNFSYAPTMGVRAQEMRALEELPEKDKDLFVPMVLLAPWTTAQKIDAAVSRIKKAYKDRRFFLDVDSSYSSERSRDAIEEFIKLKNSENSFSNWWEFVDSHEEVIPTIMISDGDRRSFETQLERAQKLGRGFAVRVTKKSQRNRNWAQIFDCLSDVSDNNFFVFADQLQTTDDELNELWLESILDLVKENCPFATFVPVASTFPESFSQFDGVTPLSNSMRSKFDQLRAGSNQTKMIFGDWAGARPRKEKRGGGDIPARIDYAQQSQWVIARKKDQWDYPQAANKLINSSFWQDDLKIWGSYLIELTKSGSKFGITSAGRNTASRINLHLHAQATFGGEEYFDTDDDWSD